MNSSRLLSSLPQECEIHRYLAALAKYQIETVGQLLSCNELEMAFVMGIDEHDTRTLLGNVCSLIAPPCVYASELSREDGVVGGGTGSSKGTLFIRMMPGMITEIAGKQGSGKSQCCKTLACEYMCRGEAVVYVDTENSFNQTRITEIFENRFQEQFPSGLFHLVNASSIQDLVTLLSSFEFESLLLEQPVSLIVLDSVSSLLVHNDIPALSKSVSHVSHVFKLPILVTNSLPSTEYGQIRTHSVSSIDSLWAHTVHHSYLIHSTPALDSTRVVTLTHSPSIALSSCGARISEQGVIFRGISQYI